MQTEAGCICCKREGLTIFDLCRFENAVVIELSQQSRRGLIFDCGRPKICIPVL